MQKSTKRLLSMLVVLALVLGFAPAGILAVETDALSTEVQQKITDARAIQDAALLLDETATTCPCHPGETVTWEPLPTAGYAAANGDHKHYYVKGTYNGTASNQIQLNGLTASDSFCLLLIDNAQMNLDGRLLFYSNSGCTYTANIMGSGTVTTDNTASGYGLLSLSGSGAHKVNLYGGTFQSTGNTSLAKAIVYLENANSYCSLNVFNDVVIGNDTVPTSESAASYNVAIASTTNGGGTLYMYGGTIKNGKTAAGASGGNVYLPSKTKAKFYMYGGTIMNGRAASQGGNIWKGASATLSILGGSIIDGVAVGGVGGNLYLANSSTGITISGATITGGESGSHGGNIFTNAGKLTLEADNTISGGDSAANGGNLYAYGASTNVTVKCDLTEGNAGMGGNVFVTNGAAVTLDGAEVKDGTLDNGTTLQNNVRVADNGKLTLMNGATCASGVLLSDSATSVLNVDTSFSGDFYVWQNSTTRYDGVAYQPGDAVRDFTCNGPFTGSVRNGNAMAYDGGNWANINMIYDGSSGLVIPTYGVFNDGSFTGFATAAEALAAYTAVPAEGETAPAYLFAADDIDIGTNDVVIDPYGDITVSGTGKVWGMDRNNGGYTSNDGSITPNGVDMQKDVTVNSRRYIALTGGDNGAKYTFHRLQVKLTNVTINPDKAGLYYKAEYKFDDKVAERAEAYGVFVALNQAATAESENFTSANVADATIENHTLASSSHGVYGIFKTTREPAANIAASKSVINGNPYITINWNGVAHDPADVDYIYMGENVAQSLESAIQLADEKWEDMSQTSKETLNAFVAHWNNLGAFDTAVLDALTNVGK